MAWPLGHCWCGNRAAGLPRRLATRAGARRAIATVDTLPATSSIVNDWSSFAARAKYLSATVRGGRFPDALRHGRVRPDAGIQRRVFDNTGHSTWGGRPNGLPTAKNFIGEFQIVKGRLRPILTEICSIPAPRACRAVGAATGAVGVGFQPAGSPSWYFCGDLAHGVCQLALASVPFASRRPSIRLAPRQPALPHSCRLPGVPLWVTTRLGK